MLFNKFIDYLSAKCDQLGNIVVTFKLNEVNYQFSRNTAYLIKDQVLKAFIFPDEMVVFPLHYKEVELLLRSKKGGNKVKDISLYVGNIDVTKKVERIIDNDRTGTSTKSY